jgi:hypothetical protein
MYKHSNSRIYKQGKFMALQPELDLLSSSPILSTLLQGLRAVVVGICPGSLAKRIYLSSLAYFFKVQSLDTPSNPPRVVLTSPSGLCLDSFALGFDIRSSSLLLVHHLYTHKATFTLLEKYSWENFDIHSFILSLAQNAYYWVTLV